MNRYQLSPHFNLVEFECLCCHRVMLDERIIPVLENVRAYIGLPIIITSGYRCQFHNQNVGGVPDSDHIYGWAVDILAGYLGDGKHKRQLIPPDELAKIIGYYLRDGRIITYSDKMCVHVGVQLRDGDIIGKDSNCHLHITPKNSNGRQA